MGESCVAVGTAHRINFYVPDLNLNLEEFRRGNIGQDGGLRSVVRNCRLYH